MAVSKTQNERPAIVALIDLSNQLEEDSSAHAQSIQTLTEGLADEVRDREAADDLLEEAIQGEAETRAQAIQDEAEARSQAVQGLQAQIGDGFAETSVTTALGATNQQVSQLGDEQDALYNTVAGIEATLECIKFGVIPNITVPANDTYSGTYTYDEPFDAGAKSFVFLGFASVESQTTLSLTLIDSSYSGFSYSVSNTDTDPATVTVGYLAIAALPLS